uniref:Uncharacterized protein n=1 Tax=Panagrolaimus superbus TaxID=310955 RepID=A0A914YUQ6_9BILA
MEELEEKRDENGCLRKEILKVVKEKNDQIEINELLKNKLEQLQNEILTAAKKQMEKSDSQRMALKEFNKSVKNVKVKKADVTKNGSIEKMKDEILRLKEKQDIQKNAIDEWTNKAMSQNASLLEKEHLIEKLNCELQSQMEETAAIKKELNLFKNEVKVQQERRTCENEIKQNRKRPSIDAKEKNPKQTKITVNQENHQPSHNSPPSFHGISAKQQQSLFQKENLPCQKSIPFQETQSRQPFTKIQNIPPGHDYSQQQPQIFPQNPQSQINYSTFSAQNSSAMQFPHYLSHFYQYFNTHPGFPNFKF